MENFDLNFMNGVELTYCLDKYDRGTVTIEILNGERHRFNLNRKYY